MLDAQPVLKKYRFKHERKGEIELIMTIDLTKFDQIKSLVSSIVESRTHESEYESLVLSERSITHKDTVYCLKTGQGFKPPEEFTKQYEQSEFCQRVRFTDKILMAAQEGNNLKVCVMNEPSSRSLNPFGWGYFGLRAVKRVIYIGANNYLV